MNSVGWKIKSWVKIQKCTNFGEIWVSS
jgi:hypothetical protein